MYLQNRAAAVPVGLDIDLAYIDVGKERKQDAEALNTRLRRCAIFDMAL